MEEWAARLTRMESLSICVHPRRKWKNTDRCNRPERESRIVGSAPVGMNLIDTRSCCSGSITVRASSRHECHHERHRSAGHRTEFTNDPMGNVTSITRLAGTSEAVTTLIPTNRPSTIDQCNRNPLGHSVSIAYRQQVQRDDDHGPVGE